MHKNYKPIDVLNAFLNELKRKNVFIKSNHTWKGWNNKALLFDVNGQIISVKADITVFALGGSIWKVKGSDGKWTNYFSEKGVEIIPFRPSNCAFAIKWKPDFLEFAEGKPLKNITIAIDDKQIAGEAVITRLGLEGGAVYALSGGIRAELNRKNVAQIFIDLKPPFSLELNCLLNINFLT